MTDKLNPSPDFPWLSDAGRVVDWSVMLISRLKQELGFNALRSNTLLPGDNPVRIALTAATTFYVSNAGSDSNNGLAAATPWLTIQHAMNTLTTAYDFGTQVVTIQLADGTYSENVSLTTGFTGGSTVFLKGNLTTPANVLINPSSGGCFTIGAPLGSEIACCLNIAGVTLTAPGGACLNLTGYTSVVISGNINFGACGSSHIIAAKGAHVLFQTATLTISGSAGIAFLQIGANAIFGANFLPPTITVTGTPNFGTALFYATRNATIIFTGGNFVGAATGKQYLLQSGTILDGGGRGTSWLPTGLTAGSTDGTAFFI